MRLGYHVISIICTCLCISSGPLSAKETGFNFIADNTFYYKTNYQTTFNSSFNFNDPKALKRIPMRIGKWQGEELLVTNQPVVKPDFMFERTYKNSRGNAIWFQLIRGRVERAVHVPTICYFNGGWQIIEQGVDFIKVGSINIPCGKIVAKKDNIYASELYFYIWQDPGRDFMKGCVMFRLATIGEGADNKDRAMFIKEFVKNMFNEVR